RPVPNAIQAEIATVTAIATIAAARYGQPEPDQPTRSTQAQTYIAVPVSPAWARLTSLVQPTTTISPTVATARISPAVAVKSQCPGADHAQPRIASMTTPNAILFGDCLTGRRPR